MKDFEDRRREILEKAIAEISGAISEIEKSNS
jgi:hypothetical protein